MANLTQDAVLPTNAATGSIDLVQLSAIIGNVAATVLRQVLVIGDPVQGLNKASVVPDEPQGWEAGLVTNVVYQKQLRDLIQIEQQVLAELQNIAVLLGGLPVTEKPNTGT